MMAIRRRRRPLRRDRAARWSTVLRGAAVAVAVLGLVVSLLIARGWQTTVSRQRDERLDRTAASRTAAITGALATYENALQAARSLWLASDSVNRAEFSSFARSLNLGDRYPGLQGIGWRTVVTDDQAAGFVARTRRDGEPGFTIKPPGRRPVAARRHCRRSGHRAASAAAPLWRRPFGILSSPDRGGLPSTCDDLPDKCSLLC